MKGLRASDVMTRPVVSACGNASARDVVLQLNTGLYSGMPVTDGKGKIIGIVTELDLLGKEFLPTCWIINESNELVSCLFKMKPGLKCL